MEPADPDDVAADTEGTVAGTVDLPDGGSLPVTLDADLAERAREEGVDVNRLHAAAVPSSATVDLQAQTNGDTTSTIPVQDHRETDLTNRLRRDRDHRFIEDDQIQRLIRNSVNYTERVGRFLLDEDDLIPTVKERIKALVVGEDGLGVEPADADSDADQRLADHLEEQYDTDVQPGKVIDRILRENLMNARAVLRATDLRELDLNSLDFLRDGISGEEIYVQDRTTVYEFAVEDEGDTDSLPGIDLERTTVDAQPLVIGDHVFDISLYDTPPLEAVADTAVNKMVLQRLKARKAEITSFGAVYAKVEPPSYLPEDQYFDRVDDDDWDGDGQPPTKLERAMKSNIQSAFDTLKDFQSGTVMSVPDFWSLEQLEIPETGDPLDDQIRGYNRDISRRLLVPLDLIELQSGSELSRETMFATLMTTIAGWRKEIIRVFDQYADAQAEIEGLDGDVVHSFPPMKDANTEQIVSALQYAGVAGLSQKEVRTMLNTVQGVDLETDQDSGGPPAGGPDDGQQRQDQMEEILEEQRRGQDQGDDSGQEDQEPPVPRPGQSPQGAEAGVAQTLRGAAADVQVQDETVDFQMDFPVSQRPNIPSRVTVETTDAVTGGRLALPAIPKRDIQADTLKDRIDDMIDGLTSEGMPINARIADRPPNHQPFVDIAGGASVELIERIADELPREYQTLLDSISGSGSGLQASRHGDVDLTIPDAVQNAAQAALDAREDPDVTVNGMTDVGWDRAEQLADGGELSPGDILDGADAMAPWWSRHFEDNLDTSGDQTTVAVDDANEDNPWADNSYTSAKGWGGVAGARFAFQKAAQLTEGDDADDWRDWVERVQASQAGGQGNVSRAGGAGPEPPAQTTAQDGSDGPAPTGRAAEILRAVPFLPDPDGDGPVRISGDRLKDWLAWVRAGRPDLEVSAAWNPTLHPRGPDGVFVERPYDIPDEIQSEIDEMDPAAVLDRLAGTSELNDDDLDALLSDGGVRIDGIPDDASSRQDLFEIAQDDTPDDGGAMADQGYVSPDAPDLRVGQAESVEPLLDDDEGQAGSAASNMDIARFDDGTTAFVKRYRNTVDGPRSEGENPTNAEREVAADQFLRNLDMGDHLPALFNNEDEGYAASEKIDGDHARLGTPGGAAEVDEEAFKDFAAATILAGNSDLHGDNWVVQDDGSFAAIDLNKSGGDFTEDGKFRRRGRNMITGVASTLGIDYDAEELTERATEIAQEIDPDAALDGVPNSDISDADRHQFRDNIRDNIEAFAAGEVSL